VRSAAGRVGSSGDGDSRLGRTAQLEKGSGSDSGSGKEDQGFLGAQGQFLVSPHLPGWHAAGSTAQTATRRCASAPLEASSWSMHFDSDAHVDCRNRSTCRLLSLRHAELSLVVLAAFGVVNRLLHRNSAGTSSHC